MKNTEVEILLVEDNLDDAELTMRALKKNKLTNKIVHMRDGVEALDFIFGKGQYEGRNISTKPKVILLDLKMPFKLSKSERTIADCTQIAPIPCNVLGGFGWF
ncbi:MAG: hypothetical protein HYZ42_04070 [Bacteroidetes bacterium]|nr:hypothetical protein [Bacteroidota bacterium]